MSIEKLDFQKVAQENKFFTTHLNVVLQNIKDPVALGIWCYLSSLPSDWKVNKVQLRKHFSLGRDVLNKVLSCLKKAKLIEFKQERNPDGTMGDGLILVKVGYEFHRDTEIQYTGENVNDYGASTAILKNRSPVNRYTGKQHLQKIDNYKRKLKEKKREPLTLNFCPNEETEALIKELNIDRLIVDQALLKFKNYFSDDSQTSDNWQAKFRVWLLNERS